MSIEILEKDYLGISGNKLFCFESDTMQFKIMCFGATLLSVRLKEDAGYSQNLVMQMDYTNGYVENKVYAGVTCGPSAGRIEQGLLKIFHNTYQLTQNSNGNNLHGGDNNISFMLWDVTEVDSDFVTFHVNLPDGLEGFPGNRDIYTKYTMNSQGSLEIEFDATSDQDTFFNLTNHSYFNLSGDFNKSIVNHALQIFASKVLYHNSNDLPNQIMPVKDTPYDYTSKTLIKNRIETTHSQILLSKGYNNAFLLDSDRKGAALIFSDEESKRTLLIDTDMPSIVVYSGGYLDSTTLLEHRIPASAACGIAFEAQFPPNCMYPPISSCEFTKAGSHWNHWIRFTFIKE